MLSRYVQYQAHVSTEKTATNIYTFSDLEDVDTELTSAFDSLCVHVEPTSCQMSNEESIDEYESTHLEDTFIAPLEDECSSAESKSLSSLSPTEPASYVQVSNHTTTTRYISILGIYSTSVWQNFFMDCLIIACEQILPIPTERG